MRQQITVGCIHIHDVKACLFGTQCGISMPAPELANIGPVHRLGLVGVACQVGHAGHIDSSLAGIKVCGAGSTYP